MDEMDYTMHTDPPALPSHYQQSQGCPYFRDHGHLQSLPSLSHPLSHPQHAHQNPLPHQHAHILPLNNANNTSRPHPQHPVQPQQHPPHAHHTHPHAPYDPVHANSTSAWYQQQLPSQRFQWSSTGGPVSLTPHSHPPPPPQLTQTNPGPGPGPGPALDGHLGGGSVVGPVPGAVSTAGTPGGSVGSLQPLVQPGLLPNQHQLPPHPHHDPFAPSYHPFAFRQAPLHHRIPPVPPPALSSHLHQHPQPQQQPPPQQPQQQQQQQQQRHQALGSADRPPPPPASLRGLHLPALNPPSAPVQVAVPVMSTSSGESSPDANQANRNSFLAGLDEPSQRRSSRNSGNGVSPTRHGLRVESATSAAPTNTEPPVLASTSSGSPNTDRRRNYTARLRLARSAQHSDYDSDDDLSADMMADDDEAMRFIEQFTYGATGLRDRESEESRIRAHQIMRGQMSTKRVASKKALSQLQSVDIASLEESERTCVICYNEFGIPNPEGINEAPLRLPNCKHIFGDHCIKKWFEESDSCPYCRDKVHSEPAIMGTRALQNYLEAAYGHSPRFIRRGSGALAPPLPAATSAAAGTSSEPPFVRVAARGQENRFDNSPPRTWHTGERRSPPTETPEARRRTRARHGSFRGTTSSTTSPTSHAGTNHAAPLPQNPTHDRVNIPHIMPAWAPLSDPHRSLTTHFVRQSMPVPGSQRPYNFNVTMSRPPSMPPLHALEPSQGLGPAAGPPTHQGVSFGFASHPGAVEDQRYPAPLNGGAMPPAAEVTHLPGPSQMAAYPQQLPSVGAMEGAAFHQPISPVASGHQHAPGSWLQ